MALLLILYTRAVFRKRHLVGWAFLGIVLLATLLTEQVWHSYFDISRALAPLITSFVLLVFLGGLEKREVVPEVSTGHVAQ
jgi:Na+/H+ antiporter NhaD/arsenite permease-like protein